MDLQKKELIDALNEKNFALALAKAKELEEKHPESPEVKVLHGNIFMEMSNYQLAIEQYERAMKINPLDPDIYAKLGAACVHLGLWEQALSYFKSAKNVVPDDYQYQGYLGSVLWNYGKMKEDNAMLSEALCALREAKNNGIEMESVNDALAEYHIESATSSWSVVKEQEGPVRYATQLDHIVAAKKELDAASSLMTDSNKVLKDQYREVLSLVSDLEKREFHGYPFVRTAAIIGGVTFLFAGSNFYGVLLLAMAALYHHAHMAPGYIANRRHVKGNFGDPFWVRRINRVGEIAGSIDIYGRSISGVLFWSWMLRVVTRVTQYMMAIVLLPFLILSGYISNYDLLEKVKRLASQGAPNN